MGSPLRPTALAVAVAALVLAAGAAGARLDGPFSIDDAISPGTISPGGSATISINATNQGGDAASMYLLLDLDPGDWSLGTASQTSGPAFSCSTSQYNMTCSIGTWPAGTSASFSIPLTLGTTLTQGQIKNTRDYIFQGQPGGAALASATYSIQVGAPAPPPPPPPPLPPPPPQPPTPTPTATLTVTRTGIGSGAVTSTPGGIDCGPTCSHSFPTGSNVTLTETPDAGSDFAGWQGACASAGTAATCTVALSADQQVSAGFAITQPPAPVSRPLRPPTQRSGCTIGRLPDRDCTPGAVLDSVSAVELCEAKSSAGVGTVSAATRQKVLTAYGIPRSHAARYVLDHLVPVGLGGTNDQANLWPEATTKPPSAHQKDRLEAWLRQRVCDGGMELSAAQIAIARNWLADYHRSGLG